MSMGDTAFAIDRAAEQVLAALRRRGFEHAQVSVSDTRRSSAVAKTTAPLTGFPD